jgi:hypothetical protein
MYVTDEHMEGCTRITTTEIKPAIIITIYSVYLTALSQYLRLYSVDVGGKPAASAQFLLNPDSSARAI